MPVRFNHTRDPRTPQVLADLVHAVGQASPSDELDWIEWKCALDLTDRPTQGTIARHVLGMANRRPDQARLHAQGCGYLVIGAEPGRLTGVAELDPADLTQAIRPYLGAEGPVWTPAYVREFTAPVLVIVVNAPKPGDRMFTLEKQLTVAGKTYLAGAIFVRHHGQTTQADPGDIRALEARLLSPTARAKERRLLIEMYQLVSGLMKESEPHANSEEELDFLVTQRLLEHVISGREDDYPAVWELIDARRGSDIFAAARLAVIEIDAGLYELDYETLPPLPPLRPPSDASPPRVWNE